MRQRWDVESGEEDAELQAWLDAAGRAGASPSLARRLNATELNDPEPDWTNATAPTLVLTRHKPAGGHVVPREYHERVVALLPNVEHVALPDGDLWPIGGGVDEVLAEISQFLTGEVRLLAPERRLTAILFTDLVGSTAAAVTVGDTRWKQVLDRHDSIVASAVKRRNGEVIKMDRRWVAGRVAVSHRCPRRRCRHPGRDRQDRTRRPNRRPRR